MTIEQRTYTIDNQTLERPSSIVWWFRCPFCALSIKAYLWSLCGSGKRCTCGAMFYSGGIAIKAAPICRRCGRPKDDQHVTSPRLCTWNPDREAVSRAIRRSRMRIVGNDQSQTG